MRGNGDRGPLWPYMLQATDKDGVLLWRWIGPNKECGVWLSSQAAALASLSEWSTVPPHIQEAARKEYNEVACAAFRKATAGLRGHEWDL